MPLTVSDISGVYSAVANVGLLLLGSISIVLACRQLNNWRAQKEYERLSSEVDEIFEILAALRDRYIIFLVKEYEMQASPSCAISERYEKLSQMLVEMRPHITRLELLKVKQGEASFAQEVSETIDKAVNIWEEQRNNYNSYSPLTEMIERAIRRPDTGISSLLDSFLGTRRVALSAEEKYYNRARTSELVESMDDLVSVIAQIIRRHAAGERLK